jgi:hypothetical protein
MPKFSGDDGIYAQFTALVRNAILGPIKDPGEAQPENQTKWAYLEDVVKFGAFASKVRTVTAAGTVTLANADPIFIEIDPNGADRDVSLPAKGNDNHGYLIRHVGTANLLSVKRSGGTVICAIRAGENYYILPSTISDFSVLEPARETQYKITPTVASNNLTVALKHLDGTDPSTSRPLWFKIADSWRAVTGALSVTVNAGASSFAAGSAELATKAIDFFPFVGWRAASSAVVLGYSRIPYATLGSDFSGTATDPKYCAWSTAPAAGDDVVNIGRFEATLSAGAGYTWTVPTFTTANLVQHPIFETRLLNYIPTPTNITLGNGTLTGTYILKNALQKYWFGLTFGSTTSFASTYVAFSVPFVPLGHGAYEPLGIGFLFDTPSASYDAKVQLLNTGPTLLITCWDTSGTHSKAANVAPTVPYTWANTDVILANGETKI